LQTSDTDIDESLIIDELPHLTTPFDGHIEQFIAYLMGRSGGGKDELKI